MNSERPGGLHTEETLGKFLLRLRLARLLASGSNDVPFIRSIRRRLLERLLHAPNIRMGSHVRLDRSHVHLGGRLKLGRDVEIGPRCILDISGGIEIQDGVTVSEDTLLLSHDHPFDDMTTHWRDQGQTPLPLIIERNAWVGARSTVIGVRIGEGAVVGATSLVTKDVPRMMLALGSPARPVRHRGERKLG